MQMLLYVSVVCLFFSRWLPLLAGAVVLQGGYMVYRGLSLGRLPLVGPHDTLVFFSLSIALMALITFSSPSLRHARRLRTSAGISAAAAVLGALLFSRLNTPLPQILDTIWFELHVVLAFFGYALFVVGALLAGAYLLRNDRAAMEVAYKVMLTGWAFFSASMVTGGIWGYYAWGTYWLWTPKELWTSILWLFYALLLHIRLKGGGYDRLAAWLACGGAAIMLFTYLGVSMLLKSSHSF